MNKTAALIKKNTKASMRTDLQKIITLNQNMLRYAQMQINNQAYLDSVCVLKQIQKSLNNLSPNYPEDFRVYILKAKVVRKIKEAMQKAASARPKKINYGPD